MNNILLKGKAVSPGKALGRAFLLNEDKLIIPKYISSFNLEQARLGQAIQFLNLELGNFKNRQSKNMSRKADLILGHYLTILYDSNLIKQTLIKIRNESLNAEWVLNNITVSEPEDSITYDIVLNLINFLLKKKSITKYEFDEPVIVVAKFLSFLELVLINPKNILGILTELNSIHTSLLARELIIPLITDLPNIKTMIKNGNLIFMDDENGTALINPSTDQLEIII